MNFHVIWNGAKNGPGGALLFGPEHETRHAERRWVAQGTLTARVRLACRARGDWFSVAEIAEETGMLAEQAKTVICNLCRSGDVEREHPHGRRGRVVGFVQRYRWAGLRTERGKG